MSFAWGVFTFSFLNVDSSYFDAPVEVLVKMCVQVESASVYGDLETIVHTGTKDNTELICKRMYERIVDITCRQSLVCVASSIIELSDAR